MAAGDAGPDRARRVGDGADASSCPAAGPDRPACAGRPGSDDRAELLARVRARLADGSYNTRAFAERVAERLLASGDLDRSADGGDPSPPDSPRPTDA